MAPALLPRTALAALAASALVLPFGAPLPGSCLRAVGTAGAAPSPSCGGDLRECLRASADMHTTTFGGRYVTADDVARCMEAFRSCTSGGAGTGGQAAPPKSPSQRGSTVLPQRFTVEGEVMMDCQRSGNSASCALSQKQLAETWASYSGEIAGTLSGVTLTGTRSEQFTSKNNSGCFGTQFHSGPVTMTFTPDGTGSTRVGPIEVEGTHEGTCSSVPTESWTIPAYDAPLRWSPA